jgi:hypothetical protein
VVVNEEGMKWRWWVSACVCVCVCRGREGGAMCGHVCALDGSDRHAVKTKPSTPLNKDSLESRRTVC